jgi:hypothetical protein
MSRRIARLALIASLALTLGACASEAPPPAPRTPAADANPPVVAAPVLLEDFAGQPIFPPNNWWNLDVTNAPVDPNSQAYIDWISNRTPQNPTARRRLHPDFGPPPYGIPYAGVSGTQPLVLIHWTHYGNESDDGAPGFPDGYPIPTEAISQPNWIEGGVAGGGPSGDRHLLLIDRDNRLLFETWFTRWNATLSRWEAGSGAVFDLDTNDRRPEGWTSADAAGLAIFPGLIRWDETYGSPAEIPHAFRFTTRATNGHVWPASHTAGSTNGAPPMGTRLRMKANVDISGYPAAIQKICRAMKKHGLILADNGSDMYIQGTMDPRWDNDILNPAFHALDADDFEVILLGWQPSTSSVPE